MSINNIIPNALPAHYEAQKKIFRLKLTVCVLGILQLTMGSIGFALFYNLDQEYVPRYKNYMEPLEAREYSLTLFAVDIFMGFWLVVVFKPCVLILRIWVVATTMLTLLTSISFFWGLPHGYSSGWKDQLLYNLGLVFRILGVCVVRKFYFGYIESRDEVIPFVKPRDGNTWPARRLGGDVPISVIPTN